MLKVPLVCIMIIRGMNTVTHSIFITYYNTKAISFLIRQEKPHLQQMAFFDARLNLSVSYPPVSKNSQNLFIAKIRKRKYENNYMCRSVDWSTCLSVCLPFCLICSSEKQKKCENGSKIGSLPSRLL